MSLKKTIGLGVLLWVLMFVVVSIFIAFKLYPGTELVVASIAGAISYTLSGYAKPLNAKEAFMFGLGWVVTGAVLDALVTTKFSPSIFQMWTLWLGYALVLLAPQLKVKR